MDIRKLGIVFGALSLILAAPVAAAPKTDGPGETVTIPFDPPLERGLQYRWQRTEDRDGKVTMSWAVNQLTFEEIEDGHRLSVKAVSSGSNETDPEKLRIRAKLEELMDLPYVLRLNADAEIVEMESGDEYWTRIFQAMREALARDKPTADEAKAIEGVISVFQQMPPDVKLSKITEPVQPLVEFGNVELTVGDPIVTEIETASPFGGILKQNVAITLHKVVNGIAFLTIRSSVPREEFAKIVGAFFDQVGKFSDKAKPEEMKKQLATAEELKFETVADYQVSTSDGMLQSYQEQRTLVAVAGKDKARQVRTTSLVRVH